jgi:hypothetical protein
MSDFQDPLPIETRALLRLSPDQRALVHRLYDTVVAYRDPHSPKYNPALTQKAIAAAAGMTEAMVCRILQRWGKGSVRSDGEIQAPPQCLAALAPRFPGPPKGGCATSDEDTERIKDLAALFIRRGAKIEPLPIKAVHQELVAEEEMTGRPAPSYAAVRSTLKRVSRQELLAWAGGVEALKKGGGMPRLMVPEPEAPNCEWVGDQWKVDAFTYLPEDVPDPRDKVALQKALFRPTVFTLIDAFGGGFILGLDVDQRFTAHTVAGVFVEAISTHGKPRRVRLDLGRENRPMRHGCSAIGTNLIHTTPRDPSVKGLIEGLHNIYRELMPRHFPYNAPSDIRTKPLRDEPPLPFPAFKERFITLALGEINAMPYHGQHARGGQSRLAIRQAAQFTPIIPDREELRVLFATQRTVTVHPQGVKLHGLVFTHPALGARIGQQLLARQGRTDVAVLLHDQHGKFVCEARNPLAEDAQLDDEGRRDYIANRRTLGKSLAALADERVSRAGSREDWTVLRATQRRRKEQAPPRQAVRQVTRMTGETPQAAAASSGRPKMQVFRTFHE